MCRVGGWRSKSEWREEGVRRAGGDHDVLCCSTKREQVEAREELDVC